jgi:hypothetical protein
MAAESKPESTKTTARKNKPQGRSTGTLITPGGASDVEHEQLILPFEIIPVNVDGNLFRKMVNNCFLNGPHSEWGGGKSPFFYMCRKTVKKKFQWSPDLLTDISYNFVFMLPEDVLWTSVDGKTIYFQW